LTLLEQCYTADVVPTCDVNITKQNEWNGSSSGAPWCDILISS